MIRRRQRSLSTAADEELVEHARGGSQAAWDELVRRFGGLVAAIARRHRLGQADAADVAQLTWLQLHRHVHRLSRPASVGGWIARTARNECLRTLDRKARELPVDPATVGDDGASAGADPLGAVLTAERAEIVRRAVAELPDRSQELIELLFWQQGTYFEVTDSLGMPRGSIGPVRGRCLRRLAARSDVAALA